MADPHNEWNLQALLGCGVRVTDDYSGMNFPRETMQQLSRGFDEVLGWHWPGSGKRFEFTRSCDNAQRVQEVSLRLAAEVDGGKSCVLCDINDRLPDEAKDLIACMMPREDAGPEERHKRLRDIETWLRENRRWLYNRKSSSWYAWPFGDR